MASDKGNSNQHSSNRGFASMDEARQREIASQGGKAAHEKAIQLHDPHAGKSLLHLISA